MSHFQITEHERERTFLVGTLLRGSRPLLSLEDSLSELARLADTAGLKVVGQTHQIMNKIAPSTLIGSGKIVEIQEELEELNVKVVVFDDELPPRHQRELEKRFGENIRLLDRSALILDIFAQHARTREGALQVELAQYEYRLPRLTRQWTHLARQSGRGALGVGLRGPGETQLEVDRREISRKISKLKSDIERLRIHRQQQRDQRRKSGIPIVALVGYTNAGKSTLLNALAGSDAYVADQLFATLDPTTRRITLPSGAQVLFTDTVGFIQKLPTTLVAAFEATLEEIAEADLLLHVVDASHLNSVEHIEAVEDTLAQIDIPDIPYILVWNKIDLLSQNQLDNIFNDVDTDVYRDTVYLSAHKKIGFDQLSTAVDSALSAASKLMTLFLPYERGDLVSFLHETATVNEQTHQADGILLKVKVPNTLYNELQMYSVSKD